MRRLPWLLLPLLAACAAEDCPPDPAALGREEGREGLAASLPSARCPLAGERLLAYQAAYRQGLSGYCSGRRGWIEGQRGREDPAPCRESEHPDFVQALRLGAEYARFATEVEGLRRELQHLPADGQAEAVRRIQRALAEMEAIRGVATVRGWTGSRGDGPG
ncbi:MAG: DUF2799 domain-containing protein [Xanthomonadales bacterium]|nr:DUF2799 domain-containing protein [Xanthomonadales bacterium]